MKDYSFGDIAYQKSFILHYQLEQRPLIMDGKIYEYITHQKIVIYFADGTTTDLDYNIKNLQIVINKMERQIEIAYKELHQAAIDWNTQDIQKLFIDLKRYIAIKSKASDIEKNKLLLDNLVFINQALHMKNRDWVTGYNLPLYLQTDLIFGKKAGKTWDLNAADKYSLKELQTILNAAKSSEYFKEGKRTV